MPYRVKIREEDDLKGNQVVDTRSYPKAVQSDPSITTTTEVTTSMRAEQHNVNSELTLLFREDGWGTKLKGFKKFRVVLKQTRAKKTMIFDLFSANEYSTTKNAYLQLSSSLCLLLESGAVLLTRELIMEIVLPTPLAQEDIGPHLVNVIENNPGTHPEWIDVIQSLLSEGNLPPKPPQQSKLEYFKQHYKGHVSTPIRESLTAVSVELLTTNATFAAVPSAACACTDEDNSERIWTNFRRGTLTKFDSQADDKSKTWLISAVEKQQLISAIILTLSGVPVGDRDYITGDTALHVAVRLGNLNLVKLLLAYRADPTIPNAADESPMSIAETLKCKSAKDINHVLKEIDKYQTRSKSYYLQNMELPEKEMGTENSIYLLSLDGGGMKSVTMCHILSAIYQRMKELHPSCKPLQSYFDYIAGTSAGAIIGGLLLYADVAVPLAGMYLYKFMVDVFGSGKNERGIKLRDYIVDLVGSETKMSDLKEGNLIVTTTLANVSPNKLHLMTSYGEVRDNQLGPDSRKVWEALVASAAAPTYFPAFESFLDGGLMSNNPTLPAMSDIIRKVKKESNKKANIKCVLSLGTGYSPPEHVDNFEVYVPGFTIDIAKNLFSSSMGLVSLLSHFVEQTTQSNGEVVRQAESWCDSIDAAYYRFSPPLPSSLAPDTHCIDDMITLLFDTELYILKEFSQIDQVAKTILNK